MCRHPSVHIVPTPQGPHHAKEVCDLCGNFVRWLPKPETLTRIRELRDLVAYLRTKELTKWEQGFLFTLEKQGFKISPKQQEIVEKLKNIYGRPVHSAEDC